MIVVTGSCRSGSSMTMQTLGLLGIDIAGEAFHDDFPVVSGNPKGYYDIPFQELADGIDADKYKDKAVKILGGRLIQQLRPPNHSFLSHIIVCKRRDTRAQDESTRKLLHKENLIDTPSEIRKRYLAECNKLSSNDLKEMRRMNYLYINLFLNQFNGEVLEVYFEDMIFQPERTVEMIRDFLCLDVPIDRAVANIGIEKGEVYEKISF